MNRTFRITLVALCVVALAFTFTPSAFAKKRVIFGGGPAGGTFQVVANGIQTYNRSKPWPISPSRPKPLRVPWKI